jgi:hypothetical protein
MNVLQARRLEYLFTQATPPPSPYDLDEKRTVEIDIAAYHDNDLELRFRCPETTLVRFAPDLFIREDGGLWQYDPDLPGTDEDKLVAIGRVMWHYDHDRHTWVMETKRTADMQSRAERSAA